MPADEIQAAVAPPPRPVPSGAAPAPERSGGFLLFALAALGTLLAGAVALRRFGRGRRPSAEPAPLPASGAPEADTAAPFGPVAAEAAAPLGPVAADTAAPLGPVAAEAAAPLGPVPTEAGTIEHQLTLGLEATRMSATLVNAVLSYRVLLTNHTATALDDVQVAGDMIAAHASRPASELLSCATGELAPLHAVGTLAPGESVTLSGELRLALNAITPIRSGNAALFVPLARLRASGRSAAGEPVRGGGTFLVGQPAASAKLQPFRLDLGPRLYSRVGQQLLAS